MVTLCFLVNIKFLFVPARISVVVELYIIEIEVESKIIFFVISIGLFFTTCILVQEIKLKENKKIRLLEERIVNQKYI